MNKPTQIQLLYEKIPKSQCLNGCAKCCYDMIQVTKEEDERMGGYKWDGKCVFLKNNQCSIHEKRAFICRLFGTSVDRKCEDCTPERYLSKEETDLLVKEYVKFMHPNRRERL